MTRDLVPPTKVELLASSGQKHVSSPKSCPFAGLNPPPPGPFEHPPGTL